MRKLVISSIFLKRWFSRFGSSNTRASATSGDAQCAHCAQLRAERDRLQAALHAIAYEGDPRRARNVRRLAGQALATGLPVHSFSGRLRRYLDGLQDSGGAEQIRVLGHHVYLFGAGGELVTAFHLPWELRAACDRAQVRSRA